jgi:alkyldihydroxyacetonephosphate synthase
MPARRRKFWGWGLEDEAPDAALLAAVEAGLAGLLGMSAPARRPPPAIEQIELAAPRIQPPAALAKLFTLCPLERAAHTYGKSYRDLVRALAGNFSRAPDLVAYPESDADLVALLDWCSSSRLAAIPYGGGSSVCGGVEPAVGDAFAGAVSIDLGKLGNVLEIDELSRAARIQAGALGPAIEAGLRPRGLTLRHFPQSFEFSSLGGWIATRSGGHFATLITHIDELVESLTLVTPAGRIETRRLPGDGAGPSPERLFIGSEGILGIITEAWMRLQPRPRFRASFSARYADFAAGARAVRALAQSGLHPANCRLLDPMEALLNGAAGGDRAILLVGFESADHPLDAWIGRAAELCRDAGGEVGRIRTSNDDESERDESAGAWRQAFLRAPYLRDELVMRGVFVETFETAITWDRLESLHAKVMAAAKMAAGEPAIVTCRITHAYPDGAAPYFTLLCPARAGAELEQWDLVKEAITGAMLQGGGTVTHHHAVGRDFRRWYDRQRPEPFASALAAAKGALDPAGVMNPGVLVG